MIKVKRERGLALDAGVGCYSRIDQVLVLVKNSRNFCLSSEDNSPIGTLSFNTKDGKEK